MKNQEAPKCPLHIGTRMVAIEAGTPFWVEAGDGLERGIPQTKGGMRKIYKCPVAGCLRVAAYAPADDEVGEYLQRDCPRCGEPTDAPGERRARNDNLCRACNKAKRDRWNGAAREKLHAKRRAQRQEAA